MTVRLKTYKRKPSPSLQSSQLKDQSMVITNYLANELQELENVLVIQEQADGEKTQTLIDLNTAVDGNTASIISEATTRSTADTALASLVTTLTATVTTGDSTNAASIIAEATARAAADTAEATARETVAASLTTEVSDREAAITTVAASVTTEATARVAADNTLLAKYGVTLNTNGYITGFSQNNDGTTGTFKILADKFTIVDPSDSAGEAGTQVFDIENGVVTMGSAHIGNLSIGTAKITDNAVTAASGAFTSADYYTNYAISNVQSGWQTIQSIAFTQSANVPTEIFWSFLSKVKAGDWDAGDDGYSTLEVRIQRSSATVLAYGILAKQQFVERDLIQMVNGSFIDTNSSGGSATYTLQVQRDGDFAQVSKRSLITTELKK